MQRCHWCTRDPDYISYHDTEWGVPSRDPRHLFEKLVLEGFQAGLSWLTVLKKRPRFRQVLFNFNPEQLAVMSDAHIQDLMHDAGIIRNRLKLEATRTNAHAWLSLPDPVGLIWSFTGGTTIVNHYSHAAQVPTVTPQAQAMSRELKKKGFRFVGPTICQSYLQAVGCFMDHTTDCHRHAQLATPFPV
jgi:DNA-3-methyladenine glycosylase I